jgi:thiol-disulfide isomerase/thioredoxin
MGLDDTRTQKINMKVEPQTFTTIKGDEITIGGVQDKPTMINLWFVGCSGCIAEIPTLNELYNKYADKVNFIAMTFQHQKQVERFLLQKKFTFTHITSADPFIEHISTSPYPESIFIDKQGYIKYVEGIIPSNEFEEIIEELIKSD